MGLNISGAIFSERGKFNMILLKGGSSSLTLTYPPVASLSSPTKGINALPQRTIRKIKLGNI